MTINFLILSNSVVLGSHYYYYYYMFLFTSLCHYIKEVEDFQFSHQLLARNCRRVVAVSKLVHALNLIETVLSALYGFSCLSVTLVIQA